MNEKELKNLISKMTIEEKASLCSGKNGFSTKEIERLGIPSFGMVDGPIGIRQEKPKPETEIDWQNSYPATCLPSTGALASTFSVETARLYGSIIGKECVHFGNSIVLGPGINIKRNPLCGRNFEYYSEDPIHTGILAKAYVEGVQREGAGACLKHFAANNQETERLTSDSVVDERTLREIYLSAFEIALKSQPYAVMCAYNLLNGIYCSQNKELLTDILRDEFGFEGMVVSDWGAVDNRVEALKAGLDLEMPSSFGVRDSQIAEAVKNGYIKEEVLDKAVFNILNVFFRISETKKEIKIDFNEHHKIAKQIAAESFVLLKNSDNILPLKRNIRIAAVGELTANPAIQGGGSAHIVPIYCDSIREELSKEFENISFFKGYELSGIYNKALADEITEAADKFDAVIFFAGCGENSEIEGYDRKNLNIPQNQIRLLRQIYRQNKNIIIVLSAGGVVDTGFDKLSKALLYCHLAGQAFGGAIADILAGRVNPFGRLSETFPKRIEDLPSYTMYPGENGKAYYGEGIFAGYRYYDKKKIKVKYPFGYGLSYTAFEYSGLNVLRKGKNVYVSVDIKNCGTADGCETVLLFVGKNKTNIIRAPKELRAFKKVFIKSGGIIRAEFILNERDFSHYDTLHKKFMAEGGTYQILICKDGERVILKKNIHYPPYRPSPLKLDRNMSIQRALKFKGGKEAVDEMIAYLRQKSGSDFNPLNMPDSYSQLVTSTHPLRALINFYEGKVTDKDLDDFIENYNERQN